MKKLFCIGIIGLILLVAFCFGNKREESFFEITDFNEQIGIVKIVNNSGFDCAAQFSFEAFPNDQLLPTTSKVYFRNGEEKAIAIPYNGLKDIKGVEINSYELDSYVDSYSELSTMYGMRVICEEKTSDEYSLLLQGYDISLSLHKKSDNKAVVKIYNDSNTKKQIDFAFTTRENGDIITETEKYSIEVKGKGNAQKDIEIEGYEYDQISLSFFQFQTKE